MKKSLQIFKRITCVLGILFIVLGVVPIPAVSVISEVSANTTVSGAGASQVLPRFSSVKLIDVLNQDEGGEAPTEEPPAPPKEELPPVEISPEPVVEQPSEEPSIEPSEEPTLPPEDLSPEPTLEPTEEIGLESALETTEEVSGETSCKSTGASCSKDNQCCSNKCSSGKCACKSDGQGCSSDGQCCSGDCHSGTCRSCAARQECPTACGQPAQDLPDGSCGTHHCEATTACCKTENQSCNLNSECCDGLTCTGHKCKVPAPTCKTAGMPCGGSNICCAGLTCQDQPGSEPDKCGVPPTPINCQYHYTDCTCGPWGCWKYLVIDQYPQNGGTACPTATFIPCGTAVNCVGAWGDCEGACGTTGTQTFTITTPAQNGGTACEAANGATRSCTTAACPPEGECPITCGYAGGIIPDGHGGLKTCPATPACPPEEECPTACGYAGGTVPDGLGGLKTCSATADCPAEQPCPTVCGYDGGTVPDGHGGLKTCSATSPCPVDCELGDYGACSATCGGGTQTQIIVVPAQYGGACNPDTRACNTDPCPVDCTGEWSACEGACGTDTGSQTFTVTQPKVGSGAACEFDDGATRACTTDPCPEDCVGAWGECAGECSTEPTVGTQTFTISHAAVGTGALCAFAEGQTQECNIDPCPVDCQWSEWSACTPAKGDCGPGTQTREIAVEAAWGGAECEGPIEQECNTGECPSQLVLDPTCSAGDLLVWSVVNSSSKDVPVTWSLDGRTGSGVAAAHTTLIIGHTKDGPAYHSMSVYWPGGSGKSSSDHDCGGGVTAAGGGGGTTAAGGIIPVTGGAGGPTEELLIIPVTGVDLGNELAGFQKLFLYMGLMMFGVTMVLEGVTKKYKI